MKTFSMSCYANEKDLYKAKAEYFESKLRDLVRAAHNNSGYEPSLSVFERALDEAKEAINYES
jgi:hypothetical protein